MEFTLKDTYESETIGQKDVRQVQGYSPQGRSSHNLRKSKTQAKAGLGNGSYSRCGFTQKKAGGVWINLYLWYRVV